MGSREVRTELRAIMLAVVFSLGAILVGAAHAGPASGAPTVTKTWALQNDVNSDGNVDPGDTIRYTVIIGVANDVVFGDGIPDPNTALVHGTVTTTQGTVLSGNGASDTQVGVMVGNISSGTVTITFDVKVADPLPGGVIQVVNQGGVACDSCVGGVMTDDPSTAAANDPTTTPVDNYAVLSATKTAALQTDADGSGNISPGDRLRYSVVITNTSANRTAGGVMFVDGVPDPNTTLVAGSVTTTQGSITTGNTSGDTTVQVNVGTLSAGGVVTIVFDAVIANPMPAGVNQVVQQGVTGCTNCSPQSVPTDDPSTATPADPTITPVVAAPNLAVTKSAALQVDADGDAQISPGDTLRYTVNVTNTGNQDAAAGFADPIPDPNTSLVAGSVTTTQGTILVGNTAGDTTVGVNLQSVAGGGGVATITFDVKIKNPVPAFVSQVGDQGGVHCANCVPQDQGTDDPSTAAANDPTITAVVSAPNLAVTKSAALQVDADGDTQISPGDTLRYTVELTNSGNQDAATTFVDAIPDANTMLVAGSVSTTQGTITTGNTAGDTNVQVDSITVGGGGGTVTITFDVKIKNPLPAFVNQVVDQGVAGCPNCTPQQVLTDDPATPAAADPTITQVVAAPKITATKTVTLLVDASGNGKADPSDVLKYTVVITNSGNQDAAGVQFTDGAGMWTTLVPGSVTTTLGSVVSGNTPNATAVGVQIALLSGGGGSATIMYQSRVNDFIGVKEIDNQGAIAGVNFPATVTDDPRTAAVNDATVILGFGRTPTPVTSDLGLVLLTALLIGVAAAGLRRAASLKARSMT